MTDVYSGRDSVMLFLFPEREGHYLYYKHGPVARTELGQLRVQGMDDAYTLQGWLKGVNPTMGGTLANGTDTTEPYPVAQDVYGFSLNYYKNDYRAIGYPLQATSVLGALGTNAAPLFNGNIAAMAVNIPKLSGTKVYNYHYDQLNRLVAMDMYNGLLPTAGTFTAVSDTSYKERISYDPNGNILTYLRNGDIARPTTDNLSYFYKPNTNQLHKVVDAATDAGATYSNYNDLKQGQNDNNYQYDAIGNLTGDAIEGITNISWNVYGKIVSITKSGAVIRYIYDGSGNRIMKQTATDTTVYVRDASGNVMSVYVRKTGQALFQTETHLYGSSRLGMATQHLAPDSSVILSGGFGMAIKSIFTRGEKFFELPNHLGNVLITITDRRVQNSAGGVTVDYYAADIATANDYYPFGMPMPSRNYTASNNYRYGFNGKENDNEVKGVGDQQDYGMRIYDARAGRFLSKDPLAPKYPELTPYQFASNSPLAGVDLDGKEFQHYLASKIVKKKGVAALKIITTADGWGPIVKATYNLRVHGDAATFGGLKDIYTRDPGMLHNPGNEHAYYTPLTKGKTIAEGDHMKIVISAIYGIVQEDIYVRFTKVNVTENSFSITAATLQGHTDAGFISFFATFDPQTGNIDFTIHNETTNNVGSDVVKYGRSVQTKQWKLILDNVEKYLMGKTLSKTMDKETTPQNPKKGDTVKVEHEDLTTGEDSESKKIYNGN